MIVGLGGGMRYVFVTSQAQHSARTSGLSSSSCADRSLDTVILRVHVVVQSPGSQGPARYVNLPYATNGQTDCHTTGPGAMLNAPRVEGA